MKIINRTPLLLIVASVTMLLLLGFILTTISFHFAEQKHLEAHSVDQGFFLERIENSLRKDINEIGHRISYSYISYSVSNSDLGPLLDDLVKNAVDTPLDFAAFLSAGGSIVVQSNRETSNAFLPADANEKKLDIAMHRASLTGSPQLAILDKKYIGSMYLVVSLPSKTAKTDEESQASNATHFIARISTNSLYSYLLADCIPPDRLMFILGEDNNVFYHNDIAITRLPNNKNSHKDDFRSYFAQAAKQDRFAGVFHSPEFAKGSEELQFAVSNKTNIGGLGLVFVVSTPKRDLLMNLTLLKRGFSITLLLLLVGVILTGQYVQKYFKRSIESSLRSDMTRELEKMVEARTVELNFVTRTIKDLIDSIPSSLIVLDRNLNVLLVNLSFYSIFSTRMVNVTGKNISELFSESFRDKLQKSLQSKDPIIDLEMRKNIEGQGEKMLLVNVLHLLGKRDRLLVVTDDITERKALERQLIQAEKMAGLGTLISGVAHEINNPLNAISGMAQIIMTRENSKETISEVKSIQEYVKRVADIVRELSRYSRSTAVTDATTSDIHSIIENALAMVVHSRKLDGVELVKSFTHDLPGIKVNVVEIEQVLINLLTNAIDALEDTETPKGSPTEKRVSISTSMHDEKTLQVVLSDTGTGIPTEALKLIFDPFYSTKEQGKGTGLGLSICYKIIQRYGGVILVESQEGAGTTFTIRLPITA